MSNSQPGSASGDQASGRFDDFTRINGITRTTARALHTAEIHTFAQLAAIDADTIATLVGGNPERIRGQDWISQALELAAQQPEPASEPGKPAPDSREAELNDRLTSQRRETFQLEFTLDTADIPRQTRVKHLQPKARRPVGDKWDDGWGGWDAQRLIDFFVTKGQIRLPDTLTDLASAERSRTASAVVQALQEWLPRALLQTPDATPEWLRQMNQENLAALQAELSRTLQTQQAELARSLGAELAQTQQAELARSLGAELAQALQAQVPAMQEQLGELLVRQLAAAPAPSPVPPEAIEAPLAALQAELSRTLQTQQAELARSLGAELAQALQAQVPAMQEQLGELLVRQLAAAPAPGLLPAEPTPPVSVMEAASPAEPTLQLQVLKVTIGETPHPPEQPPSWASRLYAELTFQLSGPADALLEIQQSPCHLQVLASETTTGDSILLAATSHPLQPLEPPAPYPQRPGAFIVRSTSRLTFGLPGLGRHQLLVSVYLPRANLVATGLSEAFSVVP